jgi:hypothetical protein
MVSILMLLKPACSRKAVKSAFLAFLQRYSSSLLTLNSSHSRMRRSFRNCSRLRMLDRNLGIWPSMVYVLMNYLKRETMTSFLFFSCDDCYRMVANFY